MAAPLVRGQGAFGSGTTSFVAAVPAGVLAGDAMYIVMESTDSATAGGTPNTPGGWTKLFEQTFRAGSSVEPAVSTLTVFGKIAGASEANVTVDGVGDHCSGAMVVVYNHGLSVIGDTVVGTAADHGTTTANNLAPSIAVDADSLIILAIGLSDDANDTTNVSGVVNANLASIVEQIDRTVSTAAGGGVGIYTATCAGTSTGTTEWDHDTAAQSESLHLGIRPVGAQNASGLATSAAWGLILATALAVSPAAGVPVSASWAVPTATAQAGDVAASGAPASASWGVPTASAQAGPVEAAGVATALSWVAPAATAQATAEATGVPGSASWVAVTASASTGGTGQNAAGAATSAPWGVPTAGAAPGSVGASGLAVPVAWAVPVADAQVASTATGIAVSLAWVVPTAGAVPGAVNAIGVPAVFTQVVPTAGATGGTVSVPGAVDLLARRDDPISMLARRSDEMLLTARYSDPTLSLLARASLREEEE